MTLLLHKDDLKKIDLTKIIIHFTTKHESPANNNRIDEKECVNVAENIRRLNAITHAQ